MNNKSKSKTSFNLPRLNHVPGRKSSTTVAQMESILGLTETAELLGCIIEGQQWNMGMSWDEAYAVESAIIRSITDRARKLNNRNG